MSRTTSLCVREKLCSLGGDFDTHAKYMVCNTSMTSRHILHSPKLFVWCDRMQSRRAAKMSCLTSTTSCWSDPRMTPRAMMFCLWTLRSRYILPASPSQCTLSLVGPGWNCCLSLMPIPYVFDTHLSQPLCALLCLRCPVG